jgi:hypothetical protein
MYRDLVDGREPEFEMSIARAARSQSSTCGRVKFLQVTRGDGGCLRVHSAIRATVRGERGGTGRLDILPMMILGQVGQSVEGFLCPVRPTVLNSFP